MLCGVAELIAPDAELTLTQFLLKLSLPTKPQSYEINVDGCGSPKPLVEQVESPG
jgi:hypothetical protein